MPSILVVEFALPVSHAVALEPFIFAAGLVLLNCVLPVCLVRFI